MTTTITIGSLSSGVSIAGCSTCAVELLLLSEDLRCEQASIINAKAMSPIMKAIVMKIYGVGVCHSWILAELERFTGLIISLSLYLSLYHSISIYLFLGDGPLQGRRSLYRGAIDVSSWYLRGGNWRNPSGNLMWGKITFGIWMFRLVGWHTTLALVVGIAMISQDFEMTRRAVIVITIQSLCLKKIPENPSLLGYAVKYIFLNCTLPNFKFANWSVGL